MFALILHRCRYRCVLLSLLLLTPISLVARRDAVAVPVTYTANLNTSAGNPVTDIMILESDGTQTFLDYSFTLPGLGTSALSHDAPFLPTESLVIGLTEGVDQQQIIMFVNNDFAEANVDVRFSEAFPNTHHSELIGRLTAAEAGDADELAWLTDTFFPGDGALASFATGGSFTVAEFTSLTVIGTNATSGNWLLEGLQEIEFEQPQTQFDLPTLTLDEGATDAGPFDVELENQRSNGLFVIETNIRNDTGGRITEVELLLGSDLGPEFMPSEMDDDVDFAVIKGPGHEDQSGIFSVVQSEVDRIVFSGGSLGPGQSAKLVTLLQTNGALPLPFTLRQTATVIPIPEPASATLLLIGTASIGLLRRRIR